MMPMSEPRSKVGFTVSVKNKLGDLTYYDIPENVYYYIKQLEAYVRDPVSSTVKERYRRRFEQGG